MRLVEPVDRTEGEDGLVNEEWQRPAPAGINDGCTELRPDFHWSVCLKVHSGTTNRCSNYVLPGDNIHCLVAGVICRRIYSN